MMADTKYLDDFENMLRDGLVKVCRNAGLLGQEKFQSSEDITAKWNDELLKDFTADAVENFNDYPEATLAWAGFLGMAVANGWDKDWSAHKSDRYQDFYGPRGFDDMDENILWNILHLKEDYSRTVSSCLNSCALATLGLIRHQGIEAQTAEGFYILIRAYSVMYEIGAAVELRRLGYKMVRYTKS